MSELAQRIIAENKHTKDPTLDLGNCGLTEFPAEALECVWVETLILSGRWNEHNFEARYTEYLTSQNEGDSNQIMILPPTLFQMQMLNKLVVNANQIADLSPLMGLDNLQLLYCSSNQITDLSPLTGLSNLKLFECSLNQIADLSPLVNLNNLRLFECSSNQITDLSPLAGLNNLQLLSCSSNQITDLSPLAGLNNLQQLYCWSNLITNLSPLARLNNLQLLNCFSNQIADLSPLAGLNNLQELDCSFNQIADLSPLAGLLNLQNLLCSSTLVKKAESLVKIKSLEYFKLNDCPIEDCPADVYQTGNPKTLRAYFSRINKKASPQKNIIKALDARKDVKLILLGNSNAGKTSLIFFIKTGEFLVPRESTHGLEVHRWFPDLKQYPMLDGIAVNIYDFGGQEYYHGAYRLFMSDNAIYMLLWDAESNINGLKPTVVNTGKEEEDLEHFDLRYWLDTIRHYGGEGTTSPLLVIQNKTDSPAGKKRLEQGLHEEYGIRESVHISLKAGCEPENRREAALLEQLRLELSVLLLEKVDKAAWPDEWLQVRQAILDLQGNKQVKNNPFRPLIKYDGSVTLAEFEAVAEKIIGKSFTGEALALLQSLERAGSVTFFPESPLLGNKVFLKPKTLVERLYVILKKEVLKSDGVFKPDEILKGKDAAYQETFLEVGGDLELIFPHPVEGEEGKYIAPQYLPETHPIEDMFDISGHGTWQTAFWLKVPLFYYKKLLHGLVLHYSSKGQATARHFWKNGIVFKKNELLVLMKGLYPVQEKRDGVILFAVQKGQNTEHLNLQREIFKKCHQLLLERGDDTAGRHKRRWVAERLKRLEDGMDVWSDGRYKEFPSWVEVSKDGVYFVPYPDMLAAHEKDEIRIDCRDKEGNKSRLLIRDLEALLPPRPYKAKKVFISYSHRNTAWLGRLLAHLGVLLRSNKIETWTDKDILPGEEWDKSINDSLLAADVFILILSADFIASNYIWDVELKKALEAYVAQGKKVIPIMMEPMDLGGLDGVTINSDPYHITRDVSIRGIEVVPKDINGYLKAVSLWDNPEEALAVVAKRIREAIG